MNDLALISGKFFETEVPKDKLFLLKYFTTKIQLAFLRYYLVFGSVANFVDHTGVYCQLRYLLIQERRYHKLLELRQEAKLAMDFDRLWKIENGKQKVSDL